MYIGIDPGLDGAIAIYRPKLDIYASRIKIHDLPTMEVTRNGKAKREFSPRGFAAILNSIVLGAPEQVEMVMLEQVGAMPKQGVSSTFAFGRTYGSIEGVLACFDLPVRRVPPQVWTKKLKIRDGKDGARGMAMDLFGADAACFLRKKDHNRADAALLAYYASRWETL